MPSQAPAIEFLANAIAFGKCSASLAVHFLEPSLPLRPALKRSVAGRNEIAVLRSAWRRLINDNWYLAGTGHM
jgi:hypothetical protein